MPLAVKYGIPLLTFYKLNPAKMLRYLPFFTEQAKQKKRDVSEAGWTNGVYVGRAIAGCFPKGKKYPDEPLVLWNDGSTDENTEPITDAERFAGFAAAFNRNFNDESTK